MQVNVRLEGADQARHRLAAINRNVVPVMRGALNTTATATRRERYVKPMGQSIKRKRLNAAMKIKRANTRHLNARIIPSSSGLLVLNYSRWGYDVLSPTRARIWVTGPHGRKVAAGFVNPASGKKFPWSTRSKKTKGSKTYVYHDWKTAMGPSAAYWFKLLTDGATIRWTNTFLAQEFERRIRQEIEKATL